MNASSGTPELKIYEKTTCTTCRQTVKLLKERGVEFEDIQYFLEPLSAAKIAELIDKMGITPRELLRTKEQAYRELELKDPAKSDLELIEAMAEHPELMQRPIAERGGSAVLCRPYDRILEILD